MKPVSSWIIVADGSRARILRDVALSRPNGKIPEEMDFVSPQQPLRKIMSDKAGRAFESSGTRGSAMEPHSDPIERAEYAFAESLAETLEAHLRDKAFSKLAVIAAPKMLSHLRNSFSDSVKKTVFAEVAKDLTKLPSKELQEAVRTLLA
ncbi:host attachment protein [Rhizobium sp. KVB221]|uniref:Host attachment protein n=1 Tax=Rhizobium setariae TaxID=2801340 RepID=A0A936YRS8_9HYPH|nr:host attachment protein [Rhizobium setariae]MBL0371611.1 host attachment protein [Rhizobium setariae]